MVRSNKTNSDMSQKLRINTQFNKVNKFIKNNNPLDVKQLSSI